MRHESTVVSRLGWNLLVWARQAKKPDMTPDDARVWLALAHKPYDAAFDSFPRPPYTAERELGARGRAVGAERSGEGV
jgi:hypothetical protein